VPAAPLRLSVSPRGALDVQVQVLHVMQEALSNVRKHARASQVTLQVHKGAAWHFAVQDNGCGFKTSQLLDNSHVGLNIMRERALRLGGEVKIISAPGQGCTLSLRLPPHPEVRDGQHRNNLAQSA
jgi:two-component system nitrate/nitrite sensor histidine kinase NarX